MAWKNLAEELAEEFEQHSLEHQVFDVMEARRQKKLEAARLDAAHMTPAQKRQKNAYSLAWQRATAVHRTDKRKAWRKARRAQRTDAEKAAEAQYFREYNASRKDKIREYKAAWTARRRAQQTPEERAAERSKHHGYIQKLKETPEGRARLAQYAETKKANRNSPEAKEKRNAKLREKRAALKAAKVK